MDGTGIPTRVGLVPPPGPTGTVHLINQLERHGIMGRYETVEAMPTEGAIRHLDAEDIEEASKAIEDGLVRSLPATEDNEKHVKAIKRYLSAEGWGCTVKTVRGVIHWQVVEKKQLSPEHKAKMQKALEDYRASKAAKANDATKAAPKEPAKTK